MAGPAGTRWQYALHIEKELKAELKKKDNLPLFEDIDSLIAGFRTACEATIFLDFEYATKEDVETRLWDAHTLINTRYRKMTQYYQKAEKDKKVEKRKLEKRYADFLKTSQFFYKGYIQRLASHFTGMKELRRIAHRLDLSTLSVDERVRVSPEVEHLIEMSCHATLLHLGDLSRYRNEIRTKDRSWAAALGYYALAGDLYPDSGSSHNQMAVIALADVNHLDVLYHLYRAIAVNEPHPVARKNLEVEFKKITTAWEKKTFTQTRNDSEATLILWFVRLHAKLYKGDDFSTHDELESEVLSRLSLLLKEQSFESTLEKFVLTNIAAEYFAAERVQELNSAANIQSFYFFLRFNVRMLFVLLRSLQPELEDPIAGEDLPNSTDGAQTSRSRDKITVITRRLLPAIRQYSIWLVSETDILVAAHPASVSVYIKELWKMYADVLTGLINLFPVGELPYLDYLLEEDQTTVGFKPLRSPKKNSNCDLYIDGEGKMKPRNTDQGIERSHPNIEMQARVRDILLCGLALAMRDDCPIALDRVLSKFAHVEEGVQHVSPITSHTAGDSVSTLAIPTHANSNFTTPDFSMQQQEQGIPEGSVAASDSQQSMDTEMHRMVDDLLEPSNGHYTASKETSYGMHSHTANEIFAPINTNLQHLHQQMLPSLPTIWSSPFTPQPNELQPTSPDRPMTARQLSPLQLSTPQQQFEAAAALDLRTGYNTSKNSWGRKSSRPQESQMSQPVNSVLQQSLAQQFRPASISSSTFTDSSSVYVNSTPRRLENHLGDGALRTGQGSALDGNNTTLYAGASDFDRNTMLQSSLWNGNSEPGWGTYTQTPLGGQGG